VRAIVTGGAGFIGSHVVDALVARGDEVLMGFYPLLDRAPMGRNEGDPSEGMWIRRHDEYEKDAVAGASG